MLGVVGTVSASGIPSPISRRLTVGHNAAFELKTKTNFTSVDRWPTGGPLAMVLDDDSGVAKCYRYWLAADVAKGAVRVKRD